MFQHEKQWEHQLRQLIGQEEKCKAICSNYVLDYIRGGEVLCAQLYNQTIFRMYHCEIQIIEISIIWKVNRSIRKDSKQTF